LFGSVTTKEVAEELAKQFGVTIDKRKISMPDAKAFGSYEAELKFAQGVTTKIMVMVTE
jgi:large subunit ribosomal protein L9